MQDSSSLELLKQLVPPPAIPLFPGSPKAWEEAEKRLQLRFPADYKSYVDTYGSGSLNEFQVFNPFTDNRYCRFDFKRDSVSEVVLNTLREHRTGRFSKLFPFPAYPEPGGLLPWGSASTSEKTYWLTKGHPDQWKVVVENPEANSEFRAFDETLTSFLAGMISRRIKHSGLGYIQYGDKPVIFEPSKPAPPEPSPEERLAHMDQIQSYLEKRLSEARKRPR